MADSEKKEKEQIMISDCNISKTVFHTSLGWAGLAVSEQGITRVVLPKKNRSTVERELAEVSHKQRKSNLPQSPLVKGGTRRSDTFTAAVEVLQKYFSGKTVVSDVPLDLRYYTAFQQAVWRAAIDIPYGETRSYGWIAKRIKKPDAARAVGQAMGANPIPVIIP